MHKRRLTIKLIYELLYVQEDIFQSVGVPLVRNALAGYNTSVLSYGQVRIDAILVLLNFPVINFAALFMEC